MNKKILLIKNPISGKKISNIILPKVISKLENIFHLEVIESEFKGHIEKILHSINIKKYNLGYFILRLDMGLKTYNPVLEPSQRWFTDFNFKKAVFNIGLNYPF